MKLSKYLFLQIFQRIFNVYNKKKKKKRKTCQKICVRVFHIQNVCLTLKTYISHCIVLFHSFINMCRQKKDTIKLYLN